MTQVHFHGTPLVFVTPASRAEVLSLRIWLELVWERARWKIILK